MLTQLMLTPLEEAAGYLIGGAVVVWLIAMVIVYIILPLVAIIATCGICYGGYFAVSNYAAAFNKVTIEGNAR